MHEFSSLGKQLHVRSDVDIAQGNDSPYPSAEPEAMRAAHSHENATIPVGRAWAWAKHGDYDWMDEHCPFISKE